MLCKLSFNNIKKSFKDYVIYFATLIIGVAIFYMFNSLDSQTAYMGLSKSNADIMKLLVGLIRAISVIVAIILGYLVIYSNRFLMRRRNKEFAVYMTLGMNKKKISLLLLVETVIVGVLSLVIGILVGSGLSQLMSVFIINMFEADLRDFRFTFSKIAMTQTITYFAIIYVVVMIFNIGIVGKCKLIDLLNSNKKVEKIRNKNLIVSTIVFILSIVSLVFAYKFILDDAMAVNKIVWAIVLGCVGTVLFFWSVSGFILKIVMGLKGVYYKSLNSFVIRQISSKLNMEVLSLSEICIMLFMTICILNVCFSMKNTLNKDFKEVAKIDYQLAKYHEADNMDPNTINTAYATMEQAGVATTDNFSEMLAVNVYNVDGITLEATVPEEYRAGLGVWYNEGYENVVKLSDYNKLAKMFGKKEHTLTDNEYMIVADFESWEELRNELLDAHSQYVSGGYVLSPKYTECVKGVLEMSTGHINPGFIVVPDYIVDNFKLKTYCSYVYGNYNASNDEEREEIEKNLSDAIPYEMGKIQALTKIELRDAVVGIGVIMVFIGLYMGVTLLIASVAMLALKSLTESNDNKQRYAVLRKLGADEKMINSALFKQVGVSFILPLALAAVHAYVGNKFAAKILSVFSISRDNTSWLMVAGLIAIIYGGYFLITYSSGKNIVNEN